MSRITEELLRKRAEHNEGCLSTLEEITLHQYELTKIENLDVLCRHLRIIYLQNNIIEKIENLNKLKELDYLNLALNNIKKIENLEGCESLRKLDLTCNFVDAENYYESLKCLQKCRKLRDFYLTGNPITDFKYYRELTIAMLDQLELLDGKEIFPSEKIKSQQMLEECLLELETETEMKKIENEKNRLKNLEESEQNENIKEEDKKYSYTPENRKEMYLKLAKEKEEDDRRKNPDKYKVKEPTPIHKPDGEIRQCNEGKYDLKLLEFEDPEFSFFEMKIPKFLETSLVDLNLFPCYVSIRIKGKLTQIKFHEEILVEKSVIQRSQTTGILTIKMPKVTILFDFLRQNLMKFYLG